MTHITSYIAIIAFAFGIRAYRISLRGLIHWDDGERMWEALTLSRYFSYLGKRLRGEPAAVPDGKYPWDANPLMCLLYGVMTTVSGNQESAGLFANVALGTIGVAGTMALAALMFGHTVAVLAGILLAVSCYHVMYSRSIHAEVSCGAFYVWATAVYVWSFASDPRWSFVAGVLAGCAFLANSRQFYVVLFLPFYELLVQAGAFGAAVGVGRTPVTFVQVIVGTGLALAAMDLWLRLLKRFDYKGLDYPRQLYQLFQVAPSRLDWRLPGLRINLRVLWETERWALVLMAAGLVRLATHWSLWSAILGAQVVPPLLMWSARPTTAPAGQEATYNFPMPRFMSTTVYALTIAAAYALDPLPFAVALAVALTLATLSLYRVRALYSMHSGFRSAIEFMARHKGSSHISFCQSNSSFYSGKLSDALDAKVFSRQEGRSFETVRRTGQYPYVLYLRAVHHLTFNPRLTLDPDLEAFVSTQTPVFSVPSGMPPWQTVYWDEYNNPNVRPLERNMIEVFELVG